MSFKFNLHRPSTNSSPLFPTSEEWSMLWLPQPSASIEDAKRNTRTTRTFMSNSPMPGVLQRTRLAGAFFVWPSWNSITIQHGITPYNRPASKAGHISWINLSLFLFEGLRNRHWSTCLMFCQNSRDPRGAWTITALAWARTLSAQDEFGSSFNYTGDITQLLANSRNINASMN